VAKSPLTFKEAEQSNKSSGLVADLLGFLKENKKWWLLPLILTFLLLATLVMLSASGVAPFIYTLF